MRLLVLLISIFLGTRGTTQVFNGDPTSNVTFWSTVMSSLAILPADEVIIGDGTAQPFTVVVDTDFSVSSLTIGFGASFHIHGDVSGNVSGQLAVSAGGLLSVDASSISAGSFLVSKGARVRLLVSSLSQRAAISTRQGPTQLHGLLEIDAANATAVGSWIGSGRRVSVLTHPAGFTGQFSQVRGVRSGHSYFMWFSSVSHSVERYVATPVLEDVPVVLPPPASPPNTGAIPWNEGWLVAIGGVGVLVGILLVILFIFILSRFDKQPAWMTRYVAVEDDLAVTAADQDTVNHVSETAPQQIVHGSESARDLTEGEGGMMPSGAFTSESLSSDDDDEIEIPTAEDVATIGLSPSIGRHKAKLAKEKGLLPAVASDAPSKSRNLMDAPAPLADSVPSIEDQTAALPSDSVESSQLSEPQPAVQGAPVVVPGKRRRRGVKKKKRRRRKSVKQAPPRVLPTLEGEARAKLDVLGERPAPLDDDPDDQFMSLRPVGEIQSESRQKALNVEPSDWTMGSVPAPVESGDSEEVSSDDVTDSEEHAAPPPMLMSPDQLDSPSPAHNYALERLNNNRKNTSTALPSLIPDDDRDQRGYEASPEHETPTKTLPSLGPDPKRNSVLMRAPAPLDDALPPVSDFAAAIAALEEEEARANKMVEAPLREIDPEKALLLEDEAGLASVLSTDAVTPVSAATEAEKTCPLCNQKDLTGGMNCSNCRTKTCKSCTRPYEVDRGDGAGFKLYLLCASCLAALMTQPGSNGKLAVVKEAGNLLEAPKRARKASTDEAPLVPVTSEQQAKQNCPVCDKSDMRGAMNCSKCGNRTCSSCTKPYQLDLGDGRGLRLQLLCSSCLSKQKTGVVIEAKVEDVIASPADVDISQAPIPTPLQPKKKLRKKPPKKKKVDSVSSDELAKQSCPVCKEKDMRGSMNCSKCGKRTCKTCTKPYQLDAGDGRGLRLQLLCSSCLPKQKTGVVVEAHVEEKVAPPPAIDVSEAPIPAPLKAEPEQTKKKTLRKRPKKKKVNSVSSDELSKQSCPVCKQKDMRGAMNCSKCGNRTCSSCTKPFQLDSGDGRGLRLQLLCSSCLPKTQSSVIIEAKNEPVISVPDAHQLANAGVPAVSAIPPNADDITVSTPQGTYKLTNAQCKSLADALRGHGALPERSETNVAADTNKGPSAFGPSTTDSLMFALQKSRGAAADNESRIVINTPEGSFPLAVQQKIALFSSLKHVDEERRSTGDIDDQIESALRAEAASVVPTGRVATATNVQRLSESLAGSNIRRVDNADEGVTVTTPEGSFQLTSAHAKALADAFRNHSFISSALRDGNANFTLDLEQNAVIMSNGNDSIKLDDNQTARFLNAMQATMEKVNNAKAPEPVSSDQLAKENCPLCGQQDLRSGMHCSSCQRKTCGSCTKPFQIDLQDGKGKRLRLMCSSCLKKLSDGPAISTPKQTKAEANSAEPSERDVNDGVASLSGTFPESEEKSSSDSVDHDRVGAYWWKGENPPNEGDMLLEAMRAGESASYAPTTSNALEQHRAPSPDESLSDAQQRELLKAMRAAEQTSAPKSQNYPFEATTAEREDANSAESSLTEAQELALLRAMRGDSVATTDFPGNTDLTEAQELEMLAAMREGEKKQISSHDSPHSASETSENRVDFEDRPLTASQEMELLRAMRGETIRPAADEGGSLTEAQELQLLNAMRAAEARSTESNSGIPTKRDDAVEPLGGTFPSDDEQQLTKSQELALLRAMRGDANVSPSGDRAERSLSEAEERKILNAMRAAESMSMKETQPRPGGTASTSPTLVEATEEDIQLTEAQELALLRALRNQNAAVPTSHVDREAELTETQERDLLAAMRAAEAKPAVPSISHAKTAEVPASQMSEEDQQLTEAQELELLRAMRNQSFGSTGDQVDQNDQNEGFTEAQELDLLAAMREAEAKSVQPSVSHTRGPEISQMPEEDQQLTEAQELNLLAAMRAAEAQTAQSSKPHPVADPVTTEASELDSEQELTEAQELQLLQMMRGDNTAASVTTVDHPDQQQEAELNLLAAMRASENHAIQRNIDYRKTEVAPQRDDVTEEEELTEAQEMAILRAMRGESALASPSSPISPGDMNRGDEEETDLMAKLRLMESSNVLATPDRYQDVQPKESTKFDETLNQEQLTEAQELALVQAMRNNAMVAPAATPDVQENVSRDTEYREDDLMAAMLASEATVVASTPEIPEQQEYVAEPDASEDYQSLTATQEMDLLRMMRSSEMAASSMTPDAPTGGATVTAVTSDEQSKMKCPICKQPDMRGAMNCSECRRKTCSSCTGPFQVDAGDGKGPRLKLLCSNCARKRKIRKGDASSIVVEADKEIDDASLVQGLRLMEKLGSQRNIL